MFLHLRHIRITFWIGFLSFISIEIYCQYSPAAGLPGSDAIYKSDPRFKEWATNCTVVRGYIQMNDTNATYSQGDTTSNRAFYGTTQNTIGEPKGGLSVLSLGDKGFATVTFVVPIKNREGPDFAIFENALQETNDPNFYFIELAYVEVSSDGNRFVRFPSISLTQANTQVASFGQIDPAKIYNLAGKYTADYGTPFDLNDLKDSTGIDLDSIRYIRVADVGGSIDPAFASYDSQGHIINDPFPTPFWNGGFDLQAIGALNVSDVSMANAQLNLPQSNILLYPNPIISNSQLFVTIPLPSIKSSTITITDMNGKTILVKVLPFAGDQESLVLPDMACGIYLVTIQNNNTTYNHKLVVKNE